MLFLLRRLALAFAITRLEPSQRKLLTDRMWDRVMKSQFPSPGKG